MCNLCILMRHGESLANKNKIVWSLKHGFPLTDLGREMVLKRIHELKKLKIDLIVTSEIERAVETAKIISSKINVPYKIDSRINEINFTIFSGNSEDIVPRYTYESVYIENWDEIMKRSLDAINSYDGSILYITHAFIIRVILSYFLDLTENNSFGINVGYATLSIINNNRIISIGAENIDLKKIQYHTMV